MKNKLWVKYGVTFLFIDVLLILLAITTSSPKEADILAIGFTQLPFSLLAVDQFNIYQTITVGLIGWFIVGSLIGLIVQKNKSKK